MASVMLFNRAQALPHDHEPAPAPEAPMQRLQRTGKRDCGFKRLVICSSTSHGPGPALWCEIILPREPVDHYIVDIWFFSKEARCATASTFSTPTVSTRSPRSWKATISPLSSSLTSTQRTRTCRMPCLS